MRKVHEHEEDAHLDASQITEQANVHSVDYDIWVDDKTGFKKIEKYDAYQHAIECSECGYVTMKIDSEEIETKPTTTEDGLLLKHYRCSYCKHREAREVVLAKLSDNA
jgi:DNA-directed RNA polymerase subunit RPC12/RpoP